MSRNIQIIDLRSLDKYFGTKVIGRDSKGSFREILPAAKILLGRLTIPVQQIPNTLITLIYSTLTENLND